MKKVILIALTTIFLIATKVFSQNDASFWNSKMAEIAMTNSSPGWVRLKADSQFTPDNFFVLNKEAFGLQQNDNMVLIKTKTDELGFTHYKYQHTYKGIKVEGCEYILHAQNGIVVSANGKLANNLDFNVSPILSENAALSVALNSINAEKYGWEVKKNDSTFWSAYPQGELLLARIDNNKDFSKNNFRLAYKFDILALTPYTLDYIYIDANTGVVIKKITGFQDGCFNGTAETLYNGQQTIVTDNDGFNYFLRDNCRGGGIQTFLAGINIYDSDNNWSLVSERPATTAHWAAEMTYDFYLNTYGRNSFDGNGAKIWVYTNDNGLGQDNAFWHPINQDLHFGSGGGGKTSNALVSLDVVGHEFTHGVTQYSAALEYSNESGALNESFSDIFGTMVEFYVEASGGNYLLSEDFWIQDGYTRSMLNPNAKTETISNPNTAAYCPGGILSKKQPDTYNGNFWFDYTSYPNCDVGGVHINSGVQNFWFYLLSEGGSGINDNGDAYNVIGIGRDKAAAIAYRNLTVYLTSNSDYADAKNGAIFAAMDLFGTCSNEVLQTINAWNAVGVFSANGFDFDIVVNCGELNFGHLFLLSPVTFSAIHDLTANCAIAPNGLPVTFIAGNRITLTDGFISGDNFHAFIDPCLGAAKSMVYNGNNNTSNNEFIENEQIKRNSIKINELNIHVFPNPTSGIITIDAESEISSIEIMDIHGRTIEYNLISTTEDQSKIELLNATAGIYFVLVNTIEGIYRTKIIVN